MKEDITIIKLSGFVAGSSIMSDMVIFTDSAYTFLSINGCFLAVVGMLHEIFKTRGEKRNVWFLFFEVVKAGILGAVLTPMLFMFLITNGDGLASNFIGFKVKGMMLSFWWALSLIGAWYMPFIWGWFLKRVKAVGNAIMGRK